MLERIKMALGLNYLKRADDPRVDHAFEWSINGERHRYVVPVVKKPVCLRIIGWTWQLDEAAMEANLIAAIKSTL
jgi:hypothetical protein